MFEPDDRPVLRAGPALACGHHTAKMLVNVVFCCLCAERMRMSPGHACGWPDDQPVLCAGAALVCGNQTAKMPLNVVFCYLCAERMRISLGHADCGPDDRPVLCAGAALVCGRHGPVPWPCGLAQDGHGVKRTRGATTLPGGQVSSQTFIYKQWSPAFPQAFRPGQGIIPFPNGEI